MQIHGGNNPGAASASLEIEALKLAKSNQEIEGQATLQLLESAADVPKASSNPAVGSNVNTFA